MRHPRSGTAFVLTALALPLIVSADALLQDLPQAQRYVSSLDPQTTWLDLQAEPGGAYAFNLMTRTREHYCTVTGMASKQADGSWQFQEEACRLRISVKGRKVQLLDDGNHCKPRYCGFNASIGKLDLTLR